MELKGRSRGSAATISDNNVDTGIDDNGPTFGTSQRPEAAGNNVVHESSDMTEK